MKKNKTKHFIVIVLKEHNGIVCSSLAQQHYNIYLSKNTSMTSSQHTDLNKVLYKNLIN